jgi:ribosomal protein S17E
MNEIRDKSNYINKIRLLMEYDLKLTNTENILEQSVIGAPNNGALVPSETEKNVDNEYPKYCDYPDKAILPGSVVEGVSGEDALIDGFCFYPTPSDNQDGKTKGIFIPSGSKINFYDVPSISTATDFFVKKHPEEKKEKILNQFSAILPIGTVSSFITPNNTRYSTWVTKLNNVVGGWTFKGYYNADKKPYVGPKWVDKRNDYQRFIDEHGFALQIGLSLATALAGVFTGGAAWVIYAEIVLEGSLGIAVGLREVEKGENVSAALSFVTGLLPMLKLSKMFRGIPESAFKELSEELAASNLKRTSDYVSFYNKLTPEKQMIMSKLLKQDDLTKGLIKKEIQSLVSSKELPNIIMKGFQKMVKENPKLLKSIDFFERLWVRELSSNLSAGIIGLLSNVYFDKQLNVQDREKLDSVFSVIPDSLKKELAFNLISNGEVAKEVINSPQMKSIIDTASKSYGKDMAAYVNTKLKEAFEKNGKPYTELPEDSTKPIENKIVPKITEDELRKKGFILYSELKNGQDFYDYIRINNNGWVKITP